MKWKDVIVERKERGLIWTNPVQVLLDHDYSRPIGEAWLCEDEGIIIADLDPINKDIRGKYPSIGYVIKGSIKEIVNIGISDTRNEDEDIEPLGYGKWEL